MGHPKDKQPVALSRRMTAGKAALSVLRACAVMVEHGVTLAIQSEDAKGPHAARVALRRLRVAIKAFEPLLDRPQAQSLHSRAKVAFRDLGPLREADVALAMFGPMMTAEAREQLRIHCAGERVAARQRLHDSGADRLGADLRRMLDGAWRGDSAQARRLSGKRTLVLAHPALDRAWRVALGSGAHLARQAAPKRHQFRKDIKTMRYLVDYFGVLWRGRRESRFVERLSELQDRLGWLNDLAEARARQDLQPGLFAEREAHSADMVRSARRDWKRLRRAGPFWQK